MKDFSSCKFNGILFNINLKEITKFSLKRSLKMYSLEIFYGILFLNCMLLFFRLKNILIILFAFEFLMVKLIFAFVYTTVPHDPISLLVFLAVAAGEASLGLTLLVSIIRQRGNDNIKIKRKKFKYEDWFRPIIWVNLMLSCVCLKCQNYLIYELD